MKARTILSGVAIAVALTGCSTQSAPLDTKQPNVSPVNKSLNTDKTNLLSATPVPGEENGTGTTNPVPQEEKKMLMEPITLYEVDTKEFEKKTSKITSYNKGEITYLADADVKSFNKGHNVTLGDPLFRTIMQIPNLIPYEYLPDSTIDEQLGKVQGGSTNSTFTLTTKADVTFTKQPYDKKTGATVVEVKVPKWGDYHVTLRSGQDSKIQIIQKIIFTKAADFDAANKGQLLLYKLAKDKLAKKITEVPYYSGGKMSRMSMGAIKSNREGHSVWMNNGELTASYMTGNLIANEVPAETIQYKTLSAKDDPVTKCLIIVPDWGTYDVTVVEKEGIHFVSEINFKLE
ncbi:hypothetical protein [Paenibacillus sp. GCM10027626]|uniref:hypothetical protein n=1 Tax=Paenibacillus sp. GCM10027626 TaxID=3273411 RepID=UPI00363DB1CA